MASNSVVADKKNISLISLGCSKNLVDSEFLIGGLRNENFSITDYPEESDIVIVKAHEAEEKTASGIILPDTAKEKPQMGEIVAVGTGKTSDAGNLVKMSLQVGDTVLYGKYSGTEINIDGQELLIMRESDVLAVL